MRKIPFLDLKSIHDDLREEIDAAINQVRGHGQFINGSEVKQFEAEWADYCGAKHAIGCANGTGALHAILECLRLGAEDEVIMPSHTFIATAEAIKLTGARPVFAEVDAQTWTLDANDIKRRITPRTKAIVAVHLYGMPADMKLINSMAREHGLAVVEDAAQAHGATLDRHRAGTLGDAAAFSFFPGKNLGAFGDAGGITTNDDALARSLALYVNHGRRGKYEHEMMGTNYRLDTLQAAILSVKLRHLESWNGQRRKVAARYRALLQTDYFHSLGVRIQQDTPGAESSWHLFVVSLPHRDAIAQELNQQGIATGIHYPIPCHLQPSMLDVADEEPLPITEQLAGSIISLPIGPTMHEEDVDVVCEALKNALKNKGKG